MRPRVVAVAAAAAVVAFGVLMAGVVHGPAAADFTSDCQNPTAVYPDVNGMPTNLNLDSTQVVLFASGTFSGSINSNLATICVATGAAFQPGSINGAARLFVRGTALMPPLAAGSGALLDNEGTVRFLAQPNTNGVTTVINHVGATIIVDAPGLALGPAVTVTNDGTIDVQGGVNLNGSTVSTSGTLTVAGAFNLVGSFTNTGIASVGGVLTVNGGGTLQNDCRLSAAGLINNQTVRNSGVVDLGAGELRNNGGAVFSQTSSAFTGGTDFVNTGSVQGSGQYLFTGSTSTQGTVAGASAAAPIVFFDASPTGTQIFDVALGVITNTVRALVVAPDPGSCTASPPTTTTTSTTSTSSTTTTTSTTSTSSTTTTTSTTSTSSTTTSSTTTTSTTLPPATTTTTPATTTTTTVAPPPSASTTSTAPTTAGTSSSVAAETVAPGGGGLPPTGSGGRTPLQLALVLGLVGAIAAITARRAANLDE